MNSGIRQVGKYYEWAIRGLTFLQSPFLLIVRLFWGWQFAVTGWGKLTNIEKVSGYFATLNIPLPTLNATMAGMTECFGGVLLLVGFLSRPAALGLTFTMLVAYITADREAVLHIFSDPESFYKAEPFTYLMAALLVLLFGPGWISIDGWIQRWWEKKKAAGEV